MRTEIIQQGLELMVFGMGTVVIFLALLVFATGVMSRTVQRLLPDPETEPANPAPTPIADTELIAVISAAIHQHRSRTK